MFSLGYISVCNHGSWAAVPSVVLETNRSAGRILVSAPPVSSHAITTKSGDKVPNKL